MKIMILLGFLLGIAGTSMAASSKTIWKGRAVLVIKKEKVESFKRSVAKIIKPTLAEKGCISYEAFQVIDEKGNETNRFEFHELWTSKEAMLIDHKENSSHMKQFFKEIKADTKDSFIEKFEVGGSYARRLN